MLGGELGETGCLCWEAWACHLEASHFTQRLFLSYRQLRIRYQNSFLHPPHLPKSRIHCSRGRGVTPRLLGRTDEDWSPKAVSGRCLHRSSVWGTYPAKSTFRLSPAAILVFPSLVSTTVPSSTETQHEPGSMAMYEEPTSIHSCLLLLY